MVSLWPKPAGFPLPDINARLRAAARSPDTGDDLRNTEFVVVIYYTVENNQAYIFYFIKTVSYTCNLLPSKFPLRTNCISFYVGTKSANVAKGPNEIIFIITYRVLNVEASSTLICRDFTPLVQRHMESSVSFWFRATSFC